MKTTTARLASFAVLAIALAASAGAEIIVTVPGQHATLTAAVAAVPNGGTIEISSGTYPSPANGFALSNLNKGFTVRAATGATVVLDGGSARPILRIENSSVASGKPIVFENLIFRNGSSTGAGFATIAGGVTLRRSETTFVQCGFENNRRSETSIGEIAGGAVGAGVESKTYILRSYFSGNSAKNNGGAIAVWNDGLVVVHDSRFDDNTTAVTDHRWTSAGGAISVVNARLYVSNSRFEGNRAGYVGGAIYGLGSWVGGLEPPSTEIRITNSTFVENEARTNGVALPGPSEAGAVHAEDETTIRIFHSRFVRNRAQTGGAVNNYRAIVEIDQSEFRGNVAEETGGGGFGGAILVLSNDTSSADPNRRAGSTTVRRSYLRGTDPPAVTVAAKNGGCIFSTGDQLRRMGAITPQGSPAETRATLVVEDVLFHDCDVSASSFATGGAIDAYLTDVDASNLMVLHSDALGNGAQGGGLRMTQETDADIVNATLARNSAVLFGGALQFQGAHVDLSASRVVVNEISPGNNEPVGSSLGAGLFTAGQDNWPTSGVRQDQTGVVSTTVFSENVGLPAFDDDRNGAGQWKNDQRYDGNTFYNTTFGTSVYSDALACCKTAAELNTLVVVRTQGNTDKSQTNNAQPGVAPIVRDLRIAPTRIVEAVAAGDPEAATRAYAGFAWSGGTATFDGDSVSGNAGVVAVEDGTYSLAVAAQSVNDTAELGPTPAGSFVAAPAYISSGGNSTLSWQTIAGEFRTLWRDQALAASTLASGSIVVTPVATTTYRAVLDTDQGAVLLETTVFVDEGDPIFEDGFETADTQEWSDVVP